MEYIKGKNIYECNLSYEEKKAVLEKVIGALDRLHRMETFSGSSSPSGSIKSDHTSIKGFPAGIRARAWRIPEQVPVPSAFTT